MSRAKKVLSFPWTGFFYIGLILILMILLIFLQRVDIRNWEDDYRQIMDENAYAWYNLFNFNFSVFEELLDIPPDLTDDQEASLLRQRLRFWRSKSEEPELIRMVLRILSVTEDHSLTPGEKNIRIDQLGEEGFHPQDDIYWLQVIRNSAYEWENQETYYSYHILNLESSPPYLTVFTGTGGEFYLLVLDEEIFFSDFLERVTSQIYKRTGKTLVGMVPAVLSRGKENKVLYSLDGKGRMDHPYWEFPLSDTDSLLPEEAYPAVDKEREEELQELGIQNSFYLYYWMNRDSPSVIFSEEEMDRENLIEPDRPILFFAYLPRNLTLKQMVLVRNLPSFFLGYASLALLGAALLKQNKYNRENRRLLIRQEEFVSSLTHELRTPLHIISNGSKNLADGFIHERDDTIRYGIIMQKEADRLSSMIENILTYSGIGRKELSREIIDLDALLEEILNPYRTLCREKGILLEENLQARIRYKGSREALTLILSNLLSNAVKYGEPGKWILFSVHLWDELVFSVRDKGPGILVHEVDRITEPFYRGEQNKDEQRHSSGLGLSIVKRITENEGGKLTILSMKGKGSTFSVYLPCPAIENGAENA